MLRAKYLNNYNNYNFKCLFEMLKNTKFVAKKNQMLNYSIKCLVEMSKNVKNVIEKPILSYIQRQMSGQDVWKR